MSPSVKILSSRGIPCTTSSFTDIHDPAGNGFSGPPTPILAGKAP